MLVINDKILCLSNPELRVTPETHRRATYPGLDILRDVESRVYSAHTPLTPREFSVSTQSTHSLQVRPLLSRPGLDDR